MHNNLFSNGHNKAEVRDALIAHQRRDDRTLKVLDGVAAACLAILLRNTAYLDTIAVFAGSWAAISAMRYFIDQSNRNFYLHRLDWEAARDD